MATVLLDVICECKVLLARIQAWRAFAPNPGAPWGNLSAAKLDTEQSGRTARIPGHTPPIWTLAV